MFDLIYQPDPFRSGTDADLLRLLQRCEDRAWDRIEVQCPDPKSVRLDIYLIKEGDFNAGAQSTNGLDEIGMTLGTIFILRDLFDQMLSHPEVLPHIGKPNREKNRAASYNPESDRIDVDDAIRAGRRFAPRCETRRKYSSALFQMAFDFVFQHEFGHVFNGHTSWLEQTLGIHAISEVGASTIPGLSGLDLQTLEMDADCFGIQDGIIRALGGRMVNGVPQYQQRTFYGSQNETIFAVIYATQSAFRILANEPIADDVEHILALDHPPAIFRQRSVLGTTYEVLKKHGLLFNEEEFREIVRKSVFETERAFKLLGKPLQRDSFADKSFKLGSELLGRLLANWQTLRPVLDTLKRGGGLAP